MTGVEMAKNVLAVKYEADDVASYLGQLEAPRLALLQERVAAYKELCLARERFRHPKDKEYTDFDRKTMLEAHTAELQAEYELVAGLEKLVAERVKLVSEIAKL